MKEKLRQNRKSNGSVGRRMTALIIIMIVTISVVMLIIGYLRFKDMTEKYYRKMGETTADIIALAIDPDSLETYLKTLTIDEKYNETIVALRRAKAVCDAKVLYVFTVSEAKDGVYYVFDTEDPEDAAEVGEFDPFYYLDEESGELSSLYPETTKEQLLAGSAVDTVMGVTQYGWILTLNKPLYGGDGTVKGYVGIDFDVNHIVAERAAYLSHLAVVILITTVVFGAIYPVIIRKTIIHPINTMAKAASNFLVCGSEDAVLISESDILSMEINTGDELQSLAESLKSMVRKIDEYLASLNIVTIKSETDVLTQLYNRGAFEQRVSAILSLRTGESQINAFFMIDVDYFKAVNDNYGHGAGDKVLSECAKALRSVTRESDVVGRLGGDEFAVFFAGVGSAKIAEDKAGQIRREWQKIIPPGGESGITASIGISFSPKDGLVYQELFNKADEALYKAKEAGRDGFAVL